MQVKAARAGVLDWPMTWPATASPDRSAPAHMMDLQTADDDALVTAFLAGEVSAFDVIFDRHRRQVYQVCYRFAGNHDDAADLVQESFVRAFRGLHQFKRDAALATWLYRVAVNTCLNRLATKRPVSQPIEDAAHAVDAANPLDEAMRREQSEKLRDAIAKLPPKQRATILLRVYQDLPHEEVARILRCTVGAAKANVFHALGNLRRMLNS